MSITVDESKAEVAEAEENTKEYMAARLRKQFDDGLITEDEMNERLPA